MQLRKPQLLFSSILLAVLLTGCGNTDTSQGPIPTDSNRYSAIHSIPEYYDDPQCCGAAEAKLYYPSPMQSEGPPYQAIFALDLTTGETEKWESFISYQKESGMGRLTVCQIVPTGDGLRLLAVSGASNTLWLVALDYQGMGLWHISVDAAGQEDWYAPRLVCDNHGVSYLLDGAGVSLFDAQGNELGHISENVEALVTLADGRAAALTRSPELTQWFVRPIDSENLAFSPGSTLYAVAGNEYGVNQRFFPGANGYDLLCATDLSLFGYTLGEAGQPGTGELILSWVNCDVEGAGLLAVAGTGEGFTCFTQSGAFGGDGVLLRPQQPSEGEPLTLTLACRELPSSVAQQVLRFNRQNAGVRVAVTDYGAVAVRSGLAAGIDQMTVDLISGKTPDLFCLTGLDQQSLIDQGLLEDLWPYIDADEGLGGRAGLVTPLLEAMSQNGHLYAVTDGFQIHTAAAYAQLVGDTPGWTAEQFRSVYNGMEDCLSIVTPSYNYREAALEDMISMCAESFIDRQNWTASFDSPEFVSLLEYVRLFPEKPPVVPEGEDWIAQRQQIMTGLWLNQLSSVKKEPLQRFGPGEVTFIGFPGVAGNGSAFRVKTPLAMWSGSPHKDQAWAFLRTVLLPENQKSLCRFGNFTTMSAIPTNRNLYEAVIRDLCVNGGGTVYAQGEVTDLPPWTQADADELWDFLSGITVVEGCDQNIAAIIRDEAARYFAGDQTAEAAASAIQSRVNLYLGERKKG